jgi:hypothetical protein
MMWLAFQVLILFYLICAYVFFFPPYVAFLFGEKPGQDKLMRTISFLLSPFFLPFIVVAWVGWGLVSVVGGVVVVFLFTWISLLVWVSARFPRGNIFKYWFKAANWVMQKVQAFLELMGVNKLFFGIPLSTWEPIKQS